MKHLAALASATLLCLVSATTQSGEASDKRISISPDQLVWVPNPATPGVMTATAWGDPATGPHGAFHKFGAGFVAPLHTHTANTRIVVISGTMSMAGEDGKETRFPAGSFFTQPNNYRHVTRCLAGADCLIYLDADAKWDIKPVEPK